MSKDIYNPDHYLNEAGYDLFEEWYIRYPFEVFRIIMWCTAERYFRRYFNKNGVEDLRKGMRVVERLEEYEERYSNEKCDKFKDESYLATQDIRSMYPTSIEEPSGCTYDEYVRKVTDRLKKGDIGYMPPKTISTDYNPMQLPKIPNYDEVLTESEKEFLDRYSLKDESNDLKKGDTDVLEAVYKVLKEVLAEDNSFESHVIVDRIKLAIYDKVYAWGDDGGSNGEEEEMD